MISPFQAMEGATTHGRHAHHYRISVASSGPPHADQGTSQVQIEDADQ
jgi:hypothetical protein